MKKKVNNSEREVLDIFWELSLVEEWQSKLDRCVRRGLTSEEGRKEAQAWLDDVNNSLYAHLNQLLAEGTS